MVKEEEIRHNGRIVDIAPDHITVEIVSESACASCHAASLCGMSEGKIKTVDVLPAPGYEIGEEVEVSLRKTMGFKAVWIAYVIPLVLLMAVLLALVSYGVGELPSGLCAIAAVAVYYLGVFLFRNKLNNEYSFYIKKK